MISQKKEFPVKSSILYTVNGISLDRFAYDFPGKIDQDLSRSLSIQILSNYSKLLWERGDTIHWKKDLKIRV
mgnify:CR=1 FL=1